MSTEVEDQLRAEIARLQGLIQSRNQQDLEYLQRLVGALQEDVKSWESEARRLDVAARELDKAWQIRYDQLVARTSASTRLENARTRPSDRVAATGSAAKQGVPSGSGA